MASRNLIGSSPQFRAVLEQIETVAPVDCTVLIEGETGTGKELIARAIHDASPRRNNSFVALNCAAVPAALLESELFGHERGAFTGAMVQRSGRFEAAHRGTIFLDEIGDLPLELQPKLLRVLQEQEFERLGSTRTVRVDVRVVAATNQDLAGMVQERKFRADLYYRLNVFPMVLPPLRERRRDIPALVEHFVQMFAERHNKIIECIPSEFIDGLQSHNWPGNIRELQNLIERAVIMTSGSVLAPLAPEWTPPARTLADAEKLHITNALRETNWKVGGPDGAAFLLGMKRTTLIDKMRRLGISRADAGARSARLGTVFENVDHAGNIAVGAHAGC
jgi:formate hydrogenlyase transcriptional activator